MFAADGFGPECKMNFSNIVLLNYILQCLAESKPKQVRHANIQPLDKHESRTCSRLYACWSKPSLAKTAGDFDPLS